MSEIENTLRTIFLGIIAAGCLGLSFTATRILSDIDDIKQDVNHFVYKDGVP